MTLERVTLSRTDVGTAEQPAKEFRLFHAGVNETEKGPLLFDDEAAASVMQRFAQQGVDLMIDLNHDSVDETAKAMRRDAQDAVGWCRLEVRPGPELWAVDVSWNADGHERITSKKQRYTSPVALFNKETKRVAEIFNIALVGQPATHGAQALIAASRAFVHLAAAPEASANEITSGLEAALRSKYPPDASGCSRAWPQDVYENTVVYSFDGKLFRVAYAYANGVASFAGEPVQVMRQYVEVAPSVEPARADSLAANKLFRLAASKILRKGKS